MSKKQQTESSMNGIFSPVFEAMTELNAQTVELNKQMQQSAKDWMALQGEAHQTTQRLMREGGAQMVQQMQGNIQQGVELSKTILEAQQTMLQETMRMMSFKQ